METKLSKLHTNLDAFICLDDRILDEILRPNDESLSKVQEKIRNFNNKEFYKIVDEPSITSKSIKGKVKDPLNKMLKKKVFYEVVGENRIELCSIIDDHCKDDVVVVSLIDILIEKDQ